MGSLFCFKFDNDNRLDKRLFEEKKTLQSTYNNQLLIFYRFAFKIQQLPKKGFSFITKYDETLRSLEILTR